MDAPSGTVFDIMRFSTRDGPGIRTTVFLKGCPLACWWCHNPESQAAQPELMYRANLCIACLACAAACPHGAISAGGDGVLTDLARCVLCGTCLAECHAEARQIVGRQMSVAQALAEIRKDVAFYDESGGGVTFSGGEPLMQAEFLAAMLHACKQEGIHTALDTSGSAPWEVIDGLRADVDLFLYDIKALDDATHQKYTGVSNRRILENLRRLSGLGHTVRVRVPLIPGINDSPQAIQALAVFVDSLPARPEVELLAYHRSGVEKYLRLGRAYALEGLIPPDEIQVSEAIEEVRSGKEITPNDLVLF
jgi:pyruvate formate lyase activating enzyme